MVKWCYKIKERQPRLLLRKFWTLIMGNHERSVFFKVLLLNKRKAAYQQSSQAKCCYKTNERQRSSGRILCDHRPAFGLATSLPSDWRWMLHACNINVRELALNVTFSVAELGILNLQRGEWTLSSFTQFANSALPVVVRGSNNGVQMGKWVQWWEAQMSGTKRWGPQIVPPPPATLSYQAAQFANWVWAKHSCKKTLEQMFRTSW